MDAPRPLSLALCQLSGAPYDAGRNRDASLAAAAAAFERGADLALLPEHPLGRAACGPLARAGDELALATIDLGEARRARDRGGRLTPRADRRADVYALAIDGELL